MDPSLANQLNTESKIDATANLDTNFRERRDVSRRQPPKVGSVVSGQVIAHINGGALISLGNGHKGILPPKEILLFNKSSTPIEALPVGSDVSVVIKKVKIRDNMKHNIDLIRERVLDPRWDDFEKNYPPGIRLTAKVYALKDFGAMIELPTGLTALVHNSELSWTKYNPKARNIFSLGQKIDVVILAVDKENFKISASYRKGFENPYDSLLDSYPLGTDTIGTIDNIIKYGILVRLDNDCIGLLHNSQFTKESSTFKAGDKLKVKILAYNSDEQKLALGVSS